MKIGQSPCTIVQGLWPDFGANLKVRKKSNFDWNQLKFSAQHKYMYTYQKNYKNGEFFPSHFYEKIGQSSCTIVQGLLPDF